ncbi:alpha-2-macroglobulin family protein, partial [Thermodesulfobacteriota bacterium]
GEIYNFFHGLKNNMVKSITSFNRFNFRSIFLYPRRRNIEYANAASKKYATKSVADIARLVAARLREDFKDTAYYQAHVTTEKDGTATLSVALPDNLTTWRAVAIAVTKATKIGYESKEIPVKKNLLVRLVMPRFFTKRDSGTITGIVHNYLNESKKVKVSLKADGYLNIVDKDELWVEVGANEEKRVDWRVDAAGSGKAKVTITALTDEESDAMQLAIPILPHGMIQYSGDSDVINKDHTSIFTIPENSLNESLSLKLTLSPTVADITTESLKYLIGYPYGCVEQTMSRFMPNILVAKSLQRMGREVPKEMGDLPDMVQKGLERLYDFQHDDGGWGWWKHDQTKPPTTAYVVYGLTVAKEADYNVKQDVLDRGVKSLIDQIKSGQAKEINSTVFVLFALAKAGVVEKELIKSAFDKIETLNNYSLAIFADALHAANEDEKAKEAIVKLVENVERLGGLAYFKSSVRKGHGWYDSNVEATAYALKAITHIDPQSDLAPKLTLWLISSRQGDRWDNTRSTAAAVMALTEQAFAAAAGNAYDFSVTVNGEAVSLPKITTDLKAYNGNIEVDHSLLKAGENSVTITKQGDGTLFYSALLRYYTDEEELGRDTSGLTVEKTTYKKVDDQWVKFDGKLTTGDEIKVALELSGNDAYEYVILEDPKPAGCDEVIKSYDKKNMAKGDWANIEHRDEKLALFVTKMTAGKKYKYEYELTAITPGEFHAMPAKAYMMYRDEIAGNSDELMIQIND